MNLVPFGCRTSHPSPSQSVSHGVKSKGGFGGRGAPGADQRFLWCFPRGCGGLRGTNFAIGVWQGGLGALRMLQLLGVQNQAGWRVLLPPSCFSCIPGAAWRGKGFLEPGVRGGHGQAGLRGNFRSGTMSLQRKSQCLGTDIKRWAAVGSRAEGTLGSPSVPAWGRVWNQGDKAASYLLRKYCATNHPLEKLPLSSMGVQPRQLLPPHPLIIKNSPGIPLS